MDNTNAIPRPTALFEAIADSLRDRILTHEFPPGFVIDESALAKELGVSRTPVREALKVLARDGFVNVVHRRATHCTVTQLTAAELAALLKLIEHLEHFHHDAADNPFLADIIRRLTDKLYLAVGPQFVLADRKARKEIVEGMEKDCAGKDVKHLLLSYFSWRRLEVAKCAMATPAALETAA
ncbi:MAG: winged helix-turn-helix domain-containing protein [Zoogloea sp.]|nr:winged helix-turn-helix domain-containing protein [Zoogloea sp.]